MYHMHTVTDRHAHTHTASHAHTHTRTVAYTQTPVHASYAFTVYMYMYTVYMYTNMQAHTYWTCVKETLLHCFLIN